MILRGLNALRMTLTFNNLAYLTWIYKREKEKVGNSKEAKVLSSGAHIFSPISAFLGLFVAKVEFY